LKWVLVGFQTGGRYAVAAFPFFMPTTRQLAGQHDDDQHDDQIFQRRSCLAPPLGYPAPLDSVMRRWGVSHCRLWGMVSRLWGKPLLGGMVTLLDGS